MSRKGVSRPDMAPISLVISFDGIVAGGIL